MPKSKGSSAARSKKDRSSNTRPAKKGRALDRVRSLYSIIRNVGMYANETEDDRKARVQRAITLIHEEPSLATRQFRMTPLKFLLESKASLSVIQSFCEDFPDVRTSTCEADAPGIYHYPLEIACYCLNTEPGVIPYLAQYFPVQVDAARDRLMSMLHFLFSQWSSRGSHPPRAAMMGQSINMRLLEDIKAVVETAQRGGYLQEDKERQSMILHWAFNRQCRKYNHIVEYLVEQCPLVTDIKIGFDNDLTNQVLDLSPSVAKLMPQLTSGDIHVYWRLERESWKTLCKALAQNSNLKRLKLIVREFHNITPMSDAIVENPQQWVWQYLYEAICLIPNLQHLVLERTSDIVEDEQQERNHTITKAVVSLLGRNTVKLLHIRHFHPIQHEEVFDALKDNTSLVELEIAACTSTNEKVKALIDVLKVHNTTLTSVLGIRLSPVDESLKMMVKYRCKLNQLGIGVARDPDTTASKLAGLVANAKSDNWGVAISGDTSAGFAYAFLRECPSIWCGSTRPGALVVAPSLR